MNNLRSVFASIVKGLNLSRFAFREDDVFLVSYPRSGNTWFRYLIANSLQPGQEWNIDNIGKVIPDLHQNEHLFWHGGSPRIIKSHMTYQDSYHKVIYLCRDGRDVAVSYYHFLSKLRGYEGDFNSFFLDYMLGNVPFGSWHRHVTQWIFEDCPQQLLVIKYEDTISSPRQILARIALFLQLDWSSETIQSAIDKSSFEKFQADYHRYKNETHWQKGFKGGVKGGPGKWREYFSPQQREKFWEVAGEVSNRLGYSEI